MEDYFARSFRVKVEDWLKLPVHSALGDGVRIILKGRERIRVSGSWQLPPQSKASEILIVQGSLACGAGCTFESEIYVKEDARIGAGSSLQSIAVDGGLILGDRSRISRWIDARGAMVIGYGSVAGVRATSGTAIRLRPGAQVGSAVAPIISSGQADPESAPQHENPPTPEFEIPGPERSESAAPPPEIAGFERRKLRKLSSDCWMYLGDLKPCLPVHVTSQLIVKGDCVFPAGSLLDEDLKADGAIALGANSISRGSVVAGGEVRLAAGCRFLGVVHAGKTIRLDSSVTGGTKTAPVAAFATGSLLLECGVLVHGKLASGSRIEVLKEGLPVD